MAVQYPRRRTQPTSTSTPDTVGFVGASSLERMAVEESLIELTRQFKAIPVQRRVGAVV